MIQSLLTDGVGIYGFYALQPYLLQLYGDRHAYMIAGLAVAIVAGAQIVGGLAVPRIRRRADVWGYGPSYVVAAGISAVALPALALSRRQNVPADSVRAMAAERTTGG